MKLFKSIKKAFKKVVKGVKKVVKKTVKGIKKVVKKVSSSKILKALAIAAAVVVTGGAAIGAFTGGTATGFAGWMMNASQAVTGGSLFGTSTALARGAGTVAKFVASPFKAVGTALGSAAGTLTDFTGITTEASRMGVTPEIQQAMAEAQVQAGISGGSTIYSAAEPTTLLGQEQAALEAAKAAGAGPETMAYLKQQSATRAATFGIPSAEIKSAGLPEIKPEAKGTMGEVAKQAVVTGAVQTGIGMAGGYIAQKYFPEDPQGQVAGLEQRFAQPLDPLKVYAAEKGIADFDITKYFTFGNTPDTGNIPLYRQDIIAIPS